MKKFLIGAFVLLMAVLFYSLFLKKSPLLEYKLNNKTYKLLTAKNSSEWEKGLMFYKDKKELKDADGMIFIFPDKQFRNFWNENTFLDLDVYWIDNDKVVGKEYLPSILKSKNIVTINSPKAVDKVIEIVR